MVHSMSHCLVLALISFLMASLAAEEASPLQRQLDGIYHHWRQAMIKKDYRAWKRATAYARQIETRNVVVSQKKRFPGAVFAIPMKPPSVTGLKLLSAKAKGPTATAIYFGKVDFQVGAPAPDNRLLILRYLKEGDEWKFYKLAVMGQLPAEVIDDIRAKRLGFLEEPEFQPSGRGPKIQRLCPKPDYITDIHLITLGFETEVTVNGISEHATADDYGTQLVIGGLRRGKNRIEIKSRPLGAKASSGQKNLKVTLHVKTGDEKNPAVKVFEFKPDPVKGPFTYTGEILADRSTLGRNAR